MIILISPAKSLDYLRAIPNYPVEIPQFIKQSKQLIEILRKLSARDLSQLMRISDNLGELNFIRNQQFDPQYKIQNLISEQSSKSEGQTIRLRPAIYAFTGDVYRGFDVDSLENSDIIFANQHLRILSGLYGLLKPLDSLQPYRLEMGTKLKINQHIENLYQYWRETITEELNKQLANNDFLLNLASEEYSEAVDFLQINKPVYQVKFLDQKNGIYKIISFHAKKARGLMARYIVSNKITQLEDIKSFNLERYYFAEQQGNTLIFKRDEL